MSDKLTPPTYSVSDIIAMRGVVEELMTPWQYQENGRAGQAPRSSDVEDQLRTYMANGTTLEELRAEAEQRYKDGLKAYEETMRWYRTIEEQRT